MMLGAPPRAKPGSLATSMARTIAADVSVAFMSCPTRLPLETDRLCAVAMINDAHEPANANQGDPTRSNRAPTGQRIRLPADGSAGLASLLVEATSFRALRLGSIAAGAATRRDRRVIFAGGSDHLDALPRRILRRDLLVLVTRRRNHHRLRHHDRAILRRSPVRHDAAGRHHHGLLHGPVLRRHDLPLIAAHARLRRNDAIGASGRRSAWDGHRRDRGHGN
jgi:hypothetical protein